MSNPNSPAPHTWIVPFGGLNPLRASSKVETLLFDKSGQHYKVGDKILIFVVQDLVHEAIDRWDGFEVVLASDHAINSVCSLFGVTRWTAVDSVPVPAVCVARAERTTQQLRIVASDGRLLTIDLQERPRYKDTVRVDRWDDGLVSQMFAVSSNTIAAMQQPQRRPPSGNSLHLSTPARRETLFVVDHLLTEHECQAVLAQVRKSAVFETPTQEYEATFRNNSRWFVDAPHLADLLWPRLQRLITVDDVRDVRPVGFGVAGDWAPVALNPRLRFSKYSANKKEHFSLHRDAGFCENNRNRTIWSLLIYLNDDFEGGETCFDEGNEQLVIQPKAGSAVVFDHHIPHQARELRSSTKYVLRLDVMFHRFGRAPMQEALTIARDPTYFHVRFLYRECIIAAQDVDPKRSTEMFVESQAVITSLLERDNALRRKQKQQNVTPSTILGVPTRLEQLAHDIVCNISQYLPVSDLLCRLGTTCVRFSSPLEVAQWRQMYARDFQAFPIEDWMLEGSEYSVSPYFTLYRERAELHNMRPVLLVVDVDSSGLIRVRTPSGDIIFPDACTEVQDEMDARPGYRFTTTGWQFAPAWVNGGTEWGTLCRIMPSAQNDTRPGTSRFCEFVERVVEFWLDSEHNQTREVLPPVHLIWSWGAKRILSKPVVRQVQQHARAVFGLNSIVEYFPRATLLARAVRQMSVVKDESRNRKLIIVIGQTEEKYTDFRHKLSLARVDDANEIVQVEEVPLERTSAGPLLDKAVCQSWSSCFEKDAKWCVHFKEAAEKTICCAGEFSVGQVAIQDADVLRRALERLCGTDTSKDNRMIVIGLIGQEKELQLPEKSLKGLSTAVTVVYLDEWTCVNAAAQHAARIG